MAKFNIQDIKNFMEQNEIAIWNGTHRDAMTGKRVKTKLSDFKTYPGLYLLLTRNGVTEYVLCDISSTKFMVQDEQDEFMKSYTHRWDTYLQLKQYKMEL